MREQQTGPVPPLEEGDNNPRYRVVHDQTYATYEEADAERRRRAQEAPDLRVRVRRRSAGYRLVVRERIIEATAR